MNKHLSTNWLNQEIVHVINQQVQFQHEYQYFYFR